MRKGGHHIDRLHLWRGRRKKKKRNRLCKALPPKIIKPKLGMYFQKEAPQKLNIFAGLH